MALFSEVAEQIYEIRPEGSGPEIFPLCTVYLVIGDKTALVEAGSSVQIPDIIDAIRHLGHDVNELAYHTYPRSFGPCRRGRSFGSAAAPGACGGPPQSSKASG